MIVHKKWKKIKADLHITLFVTCPSCEERINLFADVPGINDEGELYQDAIPNSDWSRAHDNFHCVAHCPECSKELAKPFPVEFEVKGVEY